MSKKNDQNWRRHYHEIVTFMHNNKRRPSKHRLEEHRMVNWLKYNKRKLASGSLSPAHARLFGRLLDTAKQYQRLNQYAYLTLHEPRQLQLFADNPQ